MKRSIIIECAVFVCLLLPSAVFGASAPLADAAEKGDRAALRSLLAQGAAVNASQPDGMTALHWTIYRDDFESARGLIAAGAAAAATNLYGVSPLSLACQNGSAQCVELLLNAGADPNTILRGGETALMTAARTGKPGAVKALLSRGADVNARERRGQTALMWAAAEGNTPVVEMLVAAGADIRATLPDSGFTSLCFAVREGRSATALALVKCGADVTAPMEPRKPSGKGPRPGTSPLLLAVENGHFELAMALVNAGADPNDQRSGYTALHTLSWVRKPNRGDGDDGDPAPAGSGNLGTLQFARQLIKQGADVNARLKSGKSGRGQLSRLGATPFMMAAITDDAPLMRLLVDLGADPSIPNSDGSTPLMAAAGLGSQAPSEEAGTEEEALAAVGLALNLGADINAMDQNGETAMHGAAYKNFGRMVEYLAKRGAKPEVWNRANKWGWTPMDIAQGHRPGNFKPSPDTIAAIEKVLFAAGIKPATAVAAKGAAPLPSVYAPAASTTRAP